MLENIIEILTNPWIIGIGVTVIGGIILYIIGIGKSSNKTNSGNKASFTSAGGDIRAGGDIVVGNGNKNTNKRVGILNKGKHNTFINNSFDGLDIGIQDEGVNTTAKGNKFN